MSRIIRRWLGSAYAPRRTSSQTSSSGNTPAREDPVSSAGSRPNVPHEEDDSSSVTPSVTSYGDAQLAPEDHVSSEAPNVTDTQEEDDSISVIYTPSKASHGDAQQVHKDPVPSGGSGGIDPHEEDDISTVLDTPSVTTAVDDSSDFDLLEGTPQGGSVWGDEAAFLTAEAGDGPPRPQGLLGSQDIQRLNEALDSAPNFKTMEFASPKLYLLNDGILITADAKKPNELNRSKGIQEIINFSDTLDPEDLTETTRRVLKGAASCLSELSVERLPFLEARQGNWVDCRLFPKSPTSDLKVAQVLRKAGCQYSWYIGEEWPAFVLETNGDLAASEPASHPGGPGSDSHNFLFGGRSVSRQGVRSAVSVSKDAHKTLFPEGSGTFRVVRRSRGCSGLRSNHCANLDQTSFRSDQLCDGTTVSIEAPHQMITYAPGDAIDILSEHSLFPMMGFGGRSG